MIADRYYFQQRRMVWAVVGLLSGFLLVEVSRPLWQLGAVIGIGVLLAASLYHGRTEFIVFLLLFVFAMITMHGQAQKFAFVPPQIGTSVTITGTVTEGRNGQHYIFLKGERNDALGDWAAARFQVVLPFIDETQQTAGNAAWYPAGSRLQVRGVLQLPQGQRNPGGFDEQGWLRSKQTPYKLAAAHIVCLEEPQGIRKCVWQVQQLLATQAERYLPPEQADLALALLLGEKQRLDGAFYRLTQRMGVAHIFAVSGLHAGVVGGALLLVFYLLRCERSWFALALLAGGLSFYCLLTGAPSSALRAVSMLLLVALAQRLLRPLNGLDCLAAAALLLLLDNPYLVFQAGFQLSFGVTLSLLLLVGPLQKKLQWLRWRWLRDSLAVVIAAYLGSLPLSAWHFYSISLWSPLYNLWLVPLVSLTVPLLCLAFLGSVLLPAAGAVWFLPARLSLQLLWQSTILLSQVSGRMQINMGRPDWLALACYLLLLVLFWQFLQGDRRFGHCKFLAVVCLSVTMVGLCWPRPPDTDELLYLDAGQGSCAVLRTAAGEVLLFDSGGGGDLKNCLAWYGVNQVQAIILSHGDTDHIGGLAQVLEAVPVRHLCVEAGQLQREPLQGVLALAYQQGTEITAVKQGGALALRDGSVQLQVYQDGQQGGNSRELTAILQLPWAVAAFPGDLALQGALDFVQDQRQITIWTVPHHGSRYSASEALYQLLRQKGVGQAVISAGRGNSYGHPHRQVLQLLEQTRIPYQRTDLAGAVLLRAEQ